MTGAQAQIVLAGNEDVAYIASWKAEKAKPLGCRFSFLSESPGRNEYAVIFRKGDEAFSGLTEFAEKYHVTSAHFTAIGALNGATLAWFFT